MIISEDVVIIGGETPSRLARDRYENVTSGFYSLLTECDIKAYVEQLTLICNNPNQFKIHAHEISSEPRTKVPKVFLSFFENIRHKQDKWATHNYNVQYRIFNDSKESMDEYSAFIKEHTKFRWKMLQHHRFYEVDPEMQTSDFRMIVVYAKHGEQNEEIPSKMNENPDTWVNWDMLIPVKATY